MGSGKIPIIFRSCASSVLCRGLTTLKITLHNDVVLGGLNYIKVGLSGKN